MLDLISKILEYIVSFFLFSGITYVIVNFGLKIADMSYRITWNQAISITMGMLLISFFIHLGNEVK